MLRFCSPTLSEWCWGAVVLFAGFLWHPCGQSVCRASCSSVDQGQYHRLAQLLHCLPWCWWRKTVLEFECPVHHEGYVRVNRWQCENPAVNTWSTVSKSVAVSQPWQSHKRKPRGQRLWWTQNFHQHIHCHIPNVTWTMWTKILMKKIFSRKQRNTCNQLPARHSDNACNAQLLCLGSLMAVGDWLQFSPVKACILS